MQATPYEIKTAIQIAKPANEVYEAIVDPAKMSGYFIAEGSGRIEEGKTLNWKFPEFDESFPVRGGKAEQDKSVSFYWDVDDKEMLVEMTLEAKGEATLVTVREKTADGSQPTINWLKGNTEGWANFLACLKAYLEYGINLRKGAFDYIRKS